MDFAKHGKYVNPDLYQDIEAKLMQYPDYMEKPPHSAKPTQESTLILGKLYRDVSVKEYYKDMLKSDFENSILRRYKFNKFVLRLEKEQTYTYKFEDYLVLAYDKIVDPMVEEIKAVML